MSRPNLQRDAFLAHAMHLLVVKRVWQTTGSIKVAASCRHGIYLWMVNCGRPGVWSVVGLLYAKRARCARRGFAAYVSAVPSLCSLLPAAELRIQCFSLRFVPRYSEYIRGVRDLDRNLSINTKYIYSSSIVDRARLFQTPPSTKVQLSPGWVGCSKYLWYA